MAGHIRLKGTGEGLLIGWGAGDFAVLLADLQEQLQRTASFMRGGRVLLDLGRQHLSEDELKQIRAALEREGITAWTVVSQSPGTRAAARQLDIPTAAADSPAATAAAASASAPAAVESSEEQSLFIRRTLRSGQAIRHAGHVVVFGDVNPGAEIIAGGDILVWGKLRGTVHAGAEGDERAVVAALQLNPMQLRIASHVSRSPESRSRQKPQPESACVRGNEIVAESWKA